jgi:basic membrane protein A
LFKAESFKLAIPSKWTNRVIAFFLGLSLAACNLPSLSVTDCTRPEVFCVGLVTAYGKVDDHGLNQSAWEGVQQAQAEGLINRADFIETIDARDRAKNIQTFLDDGYDLIVTVGISMDEDTRLAADDWPDRRFIGVDQPQTESRPNLAALTFPEDQGGFLAGALAGLTTQTGKVAALCEVESLASMWRTCEGFRVGVRYADPELRARVIYKSEGGTGELFNDPAWGVEQALFVLEGGTDILFAAGGETARAALETAAARSVYVIGADEDMFYQLKAADYVLSSVVKQAGTGVYGLIRLAVEGQLPAGETRGAYALGSYHSLERQVPPTVRERLEQIRRGLTDGSIQTGVPAEP